MGQLAKFSKCFDRLESTHGLHGLLNKVLKVNRQLLTSTVFSKWLKKATRAKTPFVFLWAENVPLKRTNVEELRQTRVQRHWKLRFTEKNCATWHSLFPKIATKTDGTHTDGQMRTHGCQNERTRKHLRSQEFSKLQGTYNFANRKQTVARPTHPHSPHRNSSTSLSGSRCIPPSILACSGVGRFPRMAAFSLEVRCGQDEVSSSRLHASGESSSRSDVSNLHKFVVYVSNQQSYEHVK